MVCDCCQKSDKDELVFENKFWEVILADDQAYLGRCYVTLKRHCGCLAELENEEWAEFIQLVKILESTLKKSFDATMFNWSCLMNNAYQTTSPKPHVHWHFRPRYDKKVEFAGEIFEDPEFGHHYESMRKYVVLDKVKKRVIQKIKENIQRQL